MAKFKVGDKVRVITDVASSVIVQGQVGEVGLVEFTNNKPNYYLHEGDDWCFYDHDLELVRRK